MSLLLTSYESRKVTDYLTGYGSSHTCTFEASGWLYPGLSTFEKQIGS
jgi:hypothetical protein